MGRCHEVQNLLVSCGTGSNGWEMAMGSAAVIQGLVSGKTKQEVSKELGFDVEAFAPKNRVPRPGVCQVVSGAMLLHWMVEYYCICSLANNNRAKPRKFCNCRILFLDNLMLLFVEYVPR